MNAARLIEAIEAAVDYAADEEPGVVIVAARSACVAALDELLAVLSGEEP